MDYTTIVTLLTVNLILLSIVIIVLIAVVITILANLNRLTKHLEKAAENVASTTDWLKPSKVFDGIRSLFR